MTTGVATLATTRNAAEPEHPLARVIEFIVIGGITLIIYPCGLLLREALGRATFSHVSAYAIFWIAYLINFPHFAATYVLFYRDVRARAFGGVFQGTQRTRYWFAGFVVPVLLAAWVWYALTARSAVAFGWMTTLMGFTVGWHYVKQGFGVLAVLSARRGVPIAALERRVFLFHCLAGWLWDWFHIPADFSLKSDGVIEPDIPNPEFLVVGSTVVFALSTIAVGWVLFARWQRDRKLLPLAPLVACLITVWSWVALARHEALIYDVIPALHGLQYLYFVWLLERNGWRERARKSGVGTAGISFRTHFTAFAIVTVVLGWLLFRAPLQLDRFFIASPVDAIGSRPFYGGVFLLVNVHHYFMDNVIWRRENPETRLLRDP